MDGATKAVDSLP